MSDEPPPDISAITKSSGDNPRTCLKTSSAAAWLAVSGTGCAASNTLIRPAGTEWPYLVTTAPLTLTSGHASSIAAAIAADALPAPTTTQRPRGLSGRHLNVPALTSALVTAASKRPRRK